MTAIDTGWVPARRGLRPSRDHAATALMAAAVAAGAGLRIAAARGDLWLDEIWSLKLVGGLRSPDAVFWGISHDNNHFLNSLWMYVLGQDAPAWAYRAPAVLLGTLSVAVAARIGRRRGRATGVATAWLAAAASPLVVYGSEARGYAGLILAILLAVAAFEDAMAEPDASASAWRRRSAWRLALAIGFGALCHLTMLATLAVLGTAALLRFTARGRSPRAAVDATVALFGPALAALVPAMAAMLAGAVVRGGLTVGDDAPFSVADFAEGFGGLVRLTLGLPGAMAWPAAGLLLAAALAPGRPDGTRGALALSALVAMPAAVAAARLHNVAYPRYYLVAGVVLLLIQGDAVGRLWRGAGWGRAAAALLLGAALVGHAAADRALLGDGRGNYSAALDLMAETGPIRYAADQRFQVETVARFTAARRGLALAYVAPDAFCAAPPDWYVDALDDGPALEPALALGPAACRTRYERRASFPASPLSGGRWTLYRRAG